MCTLVSLERPMAFRKSVGELILSVGGGILSAGHRSVAKERRKMIDNGRRRLCMLRLDAKQNTVTWQVTL